MAKQGGMFPLDGTLGGINFYKRKGKWVARRSGGGFTGEAIKKKDSMARVRENGSEFGITSRAKKLLRMATDLALIHIKDVSLHSRTMSMLQQVKVEDLHSERGKRSVWEAFKTAAGKKLLTDFLFAPKQDVLSLFTARPVVDLTGQTCVVPPVVATDLLFKNGATALRFQYYVVDYNVAEASYLRFLAETVFLSKEQEVSLPPSFEISDLPEIKGPRMAFLAVQYYQRQNGKLYELKEQGMAGVRCLGVFSK